MNSNGWRNWWGQGRGKFVQIAILAALGVALLVVGSVHLPTTASRPRPGPTPALEAQEALIEGQLVRILQAIPNVGKVRVAVTLSRTIQSQFVTAPNSVSGTLSPVLVQNNSGQSVVPLDQVGPAVQGVVVVARTAQNPVVRSELTNAVETLLQIPAYQVLILPT